MDGSSRLGSDYGLSPRGVTAFRIAKFSWEHVLILGVLQSDVRRTLWCLRYKYNIPNPTDGSRWMVKTCHYPNFCAKWMFTSLACGAGARVKPGVERGSAEPQGCGVTNPIKPAKWAAAFCYTPVHYNRGCVNRCRPLCGLVK